MKSAHEYKEKELYEKLEPYIGAWFKEKYHHFTPPQKYAIVEIINKKNILICAPTGSGKTFACFLGIINYLCTLSRANKLEDRIYCLYISPLKALGNDIRRNLEEPLAEIAEIMKEKEGVEIGIRVAVRTGDTTPQERQRMLRKPPHILITTPESAAIILNAPKFREEMDTKMEASEDREKIVRWLQSDYGLERGTAQTVFRYFEEQKKYVGIIPTHSRIVIEHYEDDGGRQNIVFHALYGRRTLDALSRAYAYAISLVYNTNVSITINDNGFILKLPHKRVDADSVARLVRSDSVEEMLRKSIRKTELFKRRFRHCAVRGLMVLKQYKGYEIGVGKQQRSSASILTVAKKIEDFPIVEETFREILEEVFDIEYAKEVLEGIESGDIEIRVVETPFPSPFAHNLVALQASDVVLMESRRELLQELHRRVMEYIDERNTYTVPA